MVPGIRPHTQLDSVGGVAFKGAKVNYISAECMSTIAGLINGDVCNEMRPTM